MNHPVVIYLWDGFLLTLKELLLLLGPGLLFGLILHYLADIIRFSFLRTVGVNVFAWLTAPGTVIHELSHAFFCILFGHEVRELALFRPSDKNSLGHVKHAYNPWNPYQMMGHFFIGSGPIWFGAAMLYGLSVLLLGRILPVVSVDVGFSLEHMGSSLGQIGLSGANTFRQLFNAELFKHWQVYAFLYLGISIGAHMTLSFEDLGGTLKGFAVLLVLVLLINWGTAWMGDWSQAVVTWLLKPMSVIYAVMVFTIILVAALTLPLAVFAAMAGDHRVKEQ